MLELKLLSEDCSPHVREPTGAHEIFCLQLVVAGAALRARHAVTKSVVNERQRSLLLPNGEGRAPEGLLSWWVCIITNWADLRGFFFFLRDGGCVREVAHVHIVPSQPQHK